jgi:hypothetical protein
MTKIEAHYYRPIDVRTVDHQSLRDLFGDLMDGPSAPQILGVCLGMARFLMQKNAAYGDSALKPMRIFSKADAQEQIRVRIDDKLSRLGRGSEAGEDAVLDLLGYLVLLLVTREQRRDDED